MNESLFPPGVLDLLHSAIGFFESPAGALIILSSSGDRLVISLDHNEGALTYQLLEEDSENDS